MTTPTETAIPETLNRSQAHRKLLALGMPLKVVTHVLDHPDELLHLFSPMATVVPSKEAVAIVAAYQRHVDSKETTDALEGLPADERERIETAGRTAWDTAYYALPGADAYTCRQAADEARRATVAREAAAYRARQPVNSIGTCSVCGYHGPGPGHDCRPHEPGHRVAVYPDCCLRHRTNGPKGGSCGTLAYEGPDATPETLTRAEAEERLSDAGIRLNTIDDMLSSSQKWLDGMHGLVGPKTRAILRAYVRWLNASEGIVERAIRLDREATARACQPDLTPAEEASAPGQTPIGRPPSLIADAFEAILWFLECVIGPLRPRKITPAEEIGALAACEVETDFEPDEPPDALIKLRDLVTRAAEEHARGPVPPGFAEYEAHLAATATPAQKASAERWAGGAERVTEEELAEIEARTSGPGPLAGDGELLRRCRAEIERLRGNVETLETKLADAQGEHGRLTAERSELLAALGTGKVWVCSKCPAVSPADAEYEVGNMEPCVYCEDGTARVVLGKGQDYLSALRGEGWTVAVHNDYRLNGESRTFWLFTKDGRAIKGEGRTDEEALSLCVAASGDLPSVTAALLRASRGETGPAAEDQREAALLRRHDSFDRSAPAPGHVSIPRRALEKLVDATQRDELVREAREAAEHVLLHDALRHEPARHDAEAARVAAKRGGQ